VIDAMDEYQNIDQHQVDKVFEQVADVIRKAASVSIGCKISKGRGTAVDTRVCCDPLRDTGGVWGSHALKIGIRLGTLCDAAQAEEQRDETTQAGSVLTGCRRDCLTVEEGAWI
jgi:hypothetical protein